MTPPAFDLIAPGVDGAADHGAKIDTSTIELQLAALDTRDVEQAVQSLSKPTESDWRKWCRTSSTTLQSIRLRTGTLRSRSYEGDDVEVIFSDSGIGIPPERTAGIFDPFTQVEGSRDASAGGLGLGLALVKSLTELHGGAVSVVSEGPDRGSTFYVRLPIYVSDSMIGQQGEP